MGPCPYDHREPCWQPAAAWSPISLAWGSTGWSVAISRASSPYRSSQDISNLVLRNTCEKSARKMSSYLLERLDGVPGSGACGPPTGVPVSKSCGSVPQQLNSLQTVALRNHAHALLKRENMVKPHGSLVPVSLTYRYASTPGLSTWSSTRSLQRDLVPGRSHLVEGFTLRCIQRFSLPDVATRRCRWRDNRYTRGPSNPVLSY